MSRKVGIILSAIIAVIVGLWLWAGIIPKNSTSIGGSTSVDPVMQRLTNVYKKDFNGDSFIYSSSGSTGGVNNAKSGTYKIGFISRALDNQSHYVGKHFEGTPLGTNDYKKFGNQINKYLNDTSGYSDDQLHYVQIATDAIILTYDAPDWFKNNFSKNFNIELDENGNVPDKWAKLIQNIYQGKYTWSDVAKDINKIQNTNIDVPVDNDPITAFAREPGSGTRNSFDNMFGLKTTGKVSRATIYNSNGMMYNNFRVNTFGYMSLNYLDQIQGNNNLETVLINGKDPHDKEHFSLKDISDDKTAKGEYTLTRPYIGLIKWNLDKGEMQKISNFLAWIASATVDTNKNNEVYSQYLKAGLKPEFKLDSLQIPGAKENVKVKVKDSTENQTLAELKQTINNGYLLKQ